MHGTPSLYMVNALHSRLSFGISLLFLCQKEVIIPLTSEESTTLVDSESEKKIVNLTVIFTHLGSDRVKSSNKT